MKALSLMQPWAQLVVLGIKTVETRSWSTGYRGELLIHASGGYNPDGNWLIGQIPEPVGVIHSMAIIGQVNLRNVIKAKDFIAQHNELGFDPHQLELEKLYGDLSGERFAWLMDEPVIFDGPVPAKGKLSVWEFRQCRICGCSEQDPCIDFHTHFTCGWAGPDICTYCANGKSATIVRRFKTFLKP